MKSFKTFFEELYENPPTNYQIFGERGKDHWGDIVTEGVFHSYPIGKFVEALQNLSQEYLINIKNGIVYLYSDVDIEGVGLEDIQKTTNGYGWVIVKNYYNDKFQKYIMVFEPNHPKHLTNSELKEGNFYHITSSKVFEKISKIGLAPKLSQTSFYHPGDRIYLLQIIDRNSKENYLNQLKQMLNKDVVLRVRIPSDWVIYNDPMFQVPEGIRACFVRKNIPPHLINLVGKA